MKTKDRVYSIIAAIGFLAYATLKMAYMFSIIENISNQWEYAITTSLVCVVSIVFGVALFYRKSKLLILIASGANMLLQIGLICYYCYDWRMIQFSEPTYYIMNIFGDSLDMLAASAIFFICLFECSPKLITKRSWVNDCWILPAVFLLVGQLALRINYQVYYSATWYGIVLSCIMSVAYFFTALWLKFSITLHPSITSGNYGISNSQPVFNSALTYGYQPQKSNQQFAPNTSSVPETSAADQLLVLKQMLDADVITQWEYDAKKAQILRMI